MGRTPKVFFAWLVTKLGLQPKSAFLHSMCKTYYRLDAQLVVANDSYHRVSKMDRVEDLRSFQVLGDT